MDHRALSLIIPNLGVQESSFVYLLLIRVPYKDIVDKVTLHLHKRWYYHDNILLLCNKLLLDLRNIYVKIQKEGKALTLLYSLFSIYVYSIIILLCGKDFSMIDVKSSFISNNLRKKAQEGISTLGLMK